MSYHLYADDTQIYGSFEPSESSTDEFVERIEKCISDVKIWMNKNKLVLNQDKTETMLVGSSNNQSAIQKTHIQIEDSNICFTKSVKNLGVYLDNNLSMSNQVNHIARCMYLELRNISKIRHLITTDIAARLVTSLVLSKLDYCNSLLSGITNDKIKKLQVIQNNAARLVLKKKKRDSASPLLKILHWLPVAKRIDYKVATLCFKCINQSAPEYLSDLITLYVPSRQLRSSADTLKLREPTFKKKTFGDRSFASYGPKTWNSLPKAIREAENIDKFKSQLKTFLYTL